MSLTSEIKFKINQNNTKKKIEYVLFFSVRINQKRKEKPNCVQSVLKMKTLQQQIET